MCVKHGRVIVLDLVAFGRDETDVVFFNMYLKSQYIHQKLVKARFPFFLYCAKTIPTGPESILSQDDAAAQEERRSVEESRVGSSHRKEIEPKNLPY